MRSRPPRSPKNNDREFIAAMVVKLERLATAAGVGDVGHFLRLARDACDR